MELDFPKFEFMSSVAASLHASIWSHNQATVVSVPRELKFLKVVFDERINQINMLFAKHLVGKSFADLLWELKNV